MKRGETRPAAVGRTERSEVRRGFSWSLSGFLRQPDLLVLLSLLLVPALALAADRTPKPTIVIDKPGQCVADTEIMRREHPDMLKHQRDKTLHEGIRTPRFSLNGCVECHASSKTGSVLGEQGFCQSCHAYAGVKLDCFECHASRPKLAAAAARGAKP